MNSITTLISTLSISLFLTGHASAQIEREPLEKVTLESLLEKTLQATQETQAIFDQQVAEGKQTHTAFAPNIAFAPSIDISYNDVIQNIAQNIGSSVRWGGRVINSAVVNAKTTRLTVLASTLSDEGRPIDSNSREGRFFVDLIDEFAQGINFKGHYLTFYGDVSAQLLVKNGNRQKAIPVITAQEFVDWDQVDQNDAIANSTPINSYYFLGVASANVGYQSRFYTTYYSRNRLKFEERFISPRSLRSRRSINSRGFSSRQRFNRGFNNRTSGSSSNRLSRSRGFSSSHRSGRNQRFRRH